MRKRLLRVRLWNRVWAQANYSVTDLARRFEVSRRHLERVFAGVKGKSPRAWLNDKRQRRAGQLIRQGFLGKEIAAQLGYRQLTHFSREFKRYHGVSLREARRQWQAAKSAENLTGRADVAFR